MVAGLGLAPWWFTAVLWLAACVAAALLTLSHSVGPASVMRILWHLRPAAVDPRTAASPRSHAGAALSYGAAAPIQLLGRPKAASHG
ncbi:MAG: hypothetical protein ACYDAG_14485, partial [Chloroflexota bacterium]